MSWFSKNKKEGDAGRLPEIPRTGNLMLNRKEDFQGNEEMNYFPALPPIPQKDNNQYRQNDNDFESFNENKLSDSQQDFNFAKELNERKETANSPAYNSISDMDQQQFAKNNFNEPPSNYPKPLRNFQDDQNMTSTNYNRRRVPMNLPTPKRTPMPNYRNKENENREENIQRSNMYHNVERERKKEFTKDTEPIYIRLDKFQTTIESLEEIKSKINEIESLLNKTKEIRSREDKELEEWENEIGIIKSKLDIIDKNIFEKVG